MGKMTSAPGHYMIPTAPAVGTAVAQSGSANTYGSIVSLGTSAAALFITGVYIEGIPATNLPTYLSVQLYITASTVVDTMNIPLDSSTGVAATQYACYKPIYPPVPVATSTAILAATASSVASAISWKVTLEVINQSNVVDDAIAEIVTVSGDLSATMKTSVTTAATAATPTAAAVTGAVGSVTGNVSGTVATVTNLTNAPTVGDFTAAMKTSLNSSTPTVTAPGLQNT